MKSFAREEEILVPVVREVGAAVCSIQDSAQVDEKSGGEPVTEADRAANTRLFQAIQEAFPDDAIVAEESHEDDGAWTGAHRLWFIDPIDGTREYIEGRDDFSIMVGLAVEGRAAWGIVYRPRIDALFVGGPECPTRLTQGGRVRELAVGGLIDLNAMTATVSRSHVPANLKRCLELLEIERTLGRGSVGVKVSLVSTGEADVYIHLDKGTKLWDLCAPEAILRGAGGGFTDCFGAAFDYRSRSVLNRRGIIASRCRHTEIVKRLDPVSSTFPTA